MSKEIVPIERIANRFAYSRPEGDAGFRSGRALRRATGIEPGGEAKSRAFPADFMFQLTPRRGCIFEMPIWHFTSRGGRGDVPTVRFTEQGVAMLSSVLKASVR